MSVIEEKGCTGGTGGVGVKPCYRILRSRISRSHGLDTRRFFFYSPIHDSPVRQSSSFYHCLASYYPVAFDLFLWWKCGARPADGDLAGEREAGVCFIYMLWWKTGGLLMGRILYEALSLLLRDWPRRIGGVWDNASDGFSSLILCCSALVEVVRLRPAYSLTVIRNVALLRWKVKVCGVQ